ncbi:MAG: trypsin-like peptidase domain-containing protein [Ilumatobacteraceae bacterium]
MGVTDELGGLVRSAMQAAGPSVVAIGRHGRGTGFVVAPNRVVTNAHNLRDQTTEVRFVDGRSVQGSVVGSDVDGDLVVLDVDTGDAPPLAWDDGRNVAPGDVVVAVTAGHHRRRAAWGQITAIEAGFRGPRGRPIVGAIEHATPCGPGSSGAPVLDATGHVVGINTHRLEHGFYLARAVDQGLRDAVGEMAAGRRFERLRLGVALAPAEVASRLRRAVGLDERAGLLVRGVVDGSPAAAADIREGDLLVRAGDRDLAGPDDLFEVLATLRPGAELVVSLVRGSDGLDVTVMFPAAT